MYDVNDFFCGAGGFGLGFLQAGFNIVGAWDFDKYAVKSYSHNVGDHVQHRNIAEMKWYDVAKATAWLFGFPCTDISVAGRKAGMIKGETSSGLFYEIMRLLDETKQNEPTHLPKLILAENVKQVNKYLPTIEEEYAIRGYKMYYALYNTKYWFLPQNRERYFMIGVHESIAEEFVFPEEQHEYIPKLADVLQQDVPEKYYLSEERAAKVIQEAIERIAKAGEVNVVGRLDINGHDIIKRVYDPEGIAPTLTAIKGGSQEAKILHRRMIRKLTPREYARLQGFPEDYEQVVSDTQFYKQMGNAVSVTVSNAIAKAIRNFLDDVSET